MIVFRLCKSEYAADLSGAGAEKYGGRWNNPGTAMIYTSNSRALCTAEIAVHTPLGIVPSDFVMVSIEIHDDLEILNRQEASLPLNWRKFPYDNETRAFGDRFIKNGKEAVVKVPSAVVKGEFNYLINPKHPLAKQIKIMATETVDFDERLFIR